MTRAALYCRVSTEDQAREGFSLGAQRERLHAYCEARGWRVAETYVEEGESGRTPDRPQYGRMMRERDSWDVVLVVKMDRIHRNMKNFIQMMEDLAVWEKAFVSVSESFDTSTAMGRFVMDMIQRIAQLESEQIGERVFAGMSQKARQGAGALGSPEPYGYRIVHGRYDLAEPEAAAVREMFRRYASGGSMRELAERLNASGVPSKRGAQWSKQAVARILSNPLYCGYLRWNGTVAKGAHPAIVTREAFDRVQVRIARQIRSPAFAHEPRTLAVQISGADRATIPTETRLTPGPALEKGRVDSQRR